MFPYQHSQGLDAPASHACGVCSKGRKICLRDPESFSGMKDTITRGQGGPYVSPADVLETVKLGGGRKACPRRWSFGSSLSRTELIERWSGKRAWTLESRSWALSNERTTGQCRPRKLRRMGFTNGTVESKNPVCQSLLYGGWMKTGREAVHEIHDVPRNIAVVSKAQVMRD